MSLSSISYNIADVTLYNLLEIVKEISAYNRKEEELVKEVLTSVLDVLAKTPSKPNRLHLVTLSLTSESRMMNVVRSLVYHDRQLCIEEIKYNKLKPLEQTTSYICDIDKVKETVTSIIRDYSRLKIFLLNLSDNILSLSKYYKSRMKKTVGIMNQIRNILNQAED